MSRIDKLSIAGVRSFSPHSREAIQFNTPLTLIVGYNGSGKTTIIECLKYATTGELPPNSKGGAFIHDPKLCGEKEVLAQVKLQFRSINDRQHVATRSLQLTVKKTTRSQKTLDCSLVVVNNGERTTSSTRVAQLDEMIPERLGVSPAILDAVIFCHQDESLWPLSEPAALKKRFDEIFEALKYTKAIDNLKILRKKQVEQLGKLQNDEAHNKVNKDRGERAEKRMSGLQSEIEAARETCEELTNRMEETQGAITEKHKQANSYLQIVQNLGNKRDQLSYRQDAVDELLGTIEELPDDDDTLEHTLSQYEERMRRYEEQQQQNKDQYNELQGELTAARRELSSKQAERGRHQSDKDKYERQLASRFATIQQAAQTHNLRGYDGDLSEQHVKSFNERIQKLLDDKKRDLERLQKANSTELDQATSVITELEGQKAGKTQDRMSAKQRLGAIEKRTSVLQHEAGSIDADEGTRALLDRDLLSNEEKLRANQKDFENSAWDKQISDETDKLWEMEKESEKLNAELVETSRLASERAQLDYRKKEVSDRKQRLDTLTSTWRPKLDAMLGDWDVQTVDKQYDTQLKQQGKIVSDLERHREQTRQKQQKLEYKLRTTKENLGKKTHEMSTSKDQVLVALTAVRDGAVIEDYVEEVDAAEQQAEDLRNEVSLFDALFEYYTKCKRMLDTKKKCHLCERHFDDGQTATLDRLSKKIAKHLDPKGKEETENDLKESTASLESLRSVRSAYDTWERATAELPALREEVKTIEAEYEALDRQLEDEDAAVASESEKYRDMEDLSKTVASIAQTLKDIEEGEAQVERIASQQASGGATRSAEEIQERQIEVNEKMRVTKSRVSKLSQDRQRAKDDNVDLELQISKLKNRIGEVSGRMERKQDLMTQITALKEEHSHQREAIQRADRELEAVEPRIAEAKNVRDDALNRGRAKEKVVVEERDAISTSISEIKMMDNDIQAYIDRGGPAELAANQRTITALEQRIESSESEIKEVTVRSNKLREDIDNSDRKKKNIADNLNYRKHLRTLEVLRKEISDLEDRNAHEDYERLREEATQLENSASRLLAERGSVMGSMKTKDEELDRLLKEWEMDYKDAKHKYRESHIRVETTKAAIDDLAQCSAAVDKAVMQFHSLKMAEVNRIAGELWQSTYQGTDIDTILIRSDNESSTGKRNYNYRLCMVKQDTEMDMRGRCSAGQKVLASIIIRLALAESFGVNCGLIALDEPTTNLDRDNIKSLAESLHAIIKARQAQSNFQLIVITHDEEFLRHMRCSDFCDSFFRVRRDEKQNSVISRESITKIF
ncbi:DNA repaire protein UVS6 [Sarocladium strictum]